MRILVAIDGSPNANLCLNYLSSSRVGVNDEIKIVAIYDSHPLSIIPARLSKAAAEQVVSDGLKQLTDKFGTSVSGECLKGNVSPRLIEVSEHWQADKILIGAHWRTDLPEGLIGNITKEVLHRSKKSVIIFKQNNVKQSDANRQKILVCLNDYQLAEQLFKRIDEITFPPNSQLRFLQVHTPGRENKEYAREFREYMQRFIAQISSTRPDLLVESGIIDARNPATGILNDSIAWQADFILMVTPDYSPLERDAIGSVTEEVANKAACSLYILRVAV